MRLVRSTTIIERCGRARKDGLIERLDEIDRGLRDVMGYLMGMDGKLDRILWSLDEDDEDDDDGEEEPDR